MSVLLSDPGGSPFHFHLSNTHLVQIPLFTQGVLQSVGLAFQPHGGLVCPGQIPGWPTCAFHVPWPPPSFSVTKGSLEQSTLKRWSNPASTLADAFSSHPQCHLLCLPLYSFVAPFRTNPWPRHPSASHLCWWGFDPWHSHEGSLWSSLQQVQDSFLSHIHLTS